MNPKYLRIDQVPDELGGVVTRSTVYRWCASGHFPAPLRLGPRRSVWVAAEVQAWLDVLIDPLANFCRLPDKMSNRSRALEGDLMGEKLQIPMFPGEVVLGVAVLPYGHEQSGEVQFCLIVILPSNDCLVVWRPDRQGFDFVRDPELWQKLVREARAHHHEHIERAATENRMLD